MTCWRHEGAIITPARHTGKGQEQGSRDRHSPAGAADRGTLPDVHLLRRSTVLAAALALGLLAAACGSSDSPPDLTSDDSAAPTTAAPSTTPPVDTSASQAFLQAACAGDTSVQAVGELPPDLNEVSGLVASRRHDGVLWAVEDSLEPADVVALAEDGTVLGTVSFTGSPVVNLDWEDLALAPGPDGEDWLYVADIGDNFQARRNVDVYRFPEPEPRDGTVEAERLTSTYEAGPTDAEALTVTAAGTFIVGKLLDQPAPVYRLDEATGTFVATGTTVDTGGELVTALDVSPDGSLLALRTYDQVRLYPLGPDGDVAAALAAGDPCPTAPLDEPQGETVALLPEGRGLITISEAPEGVAAVNLTASG